MAGKEAVSWMYEGASSIVNRDEYLTGRKVDKNFELYGTEKDKNNSEARFDILSVKAKDTSDAPVLDLETVKKEDPLVAIKVREEKIRREIVDNPIKMKRLQKIVMSTMEKKMKKIMKKAQRSRSSSCSGSEAEGAVRRETRRHGKRNSSIKVGSFRGNRNDSPPRRSRDFSSSHSRFTEESRNRSDRRRRSRSPRSFGSFERIPECATAGQRHRSGISKTDSVDYSESDSDTEKRRKKFAGYGLVKVSAKSDESRSLASSGGISERKRRSSPEVRNKEPEVKNKKKLTQEEMEAKRREMMDNAKWRDEQRSRNLKNYARKEKEEEERDVKTSKESADFIRPMLAKAADTGTVESRIKRNVHNLQRGYGAMNSNFARK